jgi:5-formyltetrahydrofolate cyclo-ligase
LPAIPIRHSLRIDSRPAGFSSAAPWLSLRRLQRTSNCTPAAPIAAVRVDLTDRNALRAQLRAQRERLAPAERIAAATGVAQMLEQLPEFLVDTLVAGYWAVGGELPLHAAHAALTRRGQNYHLPVLMPGRSLRFAPWRRGIELQPNRYGIPEPQYARLDLLAPEALELVLVPLIGFDRRGHRLGTGGGYYDRSFAFLKGIARPAPPVLVGIGYSFQELPALPDEGWDIQMDFVATERELIDCTQAV